MGKYKLSNGLYVVPDKDMKVLHEMSLKGYHVDSLNAFGFYHFVKGPSEDYTYSFNSEVDLKDDFLEFYKESGWTPIIVKEGIQIFRAPSGVTPIFTDHETKLELIQCHKKTYLKATIITFLLLISFTFVANILDFGFWEVVIWAILWVPFAFTLTPYIGLVRADKKCRNS